MDWKELYGPGEQRRYGNTWAVPAEVWMREEAAQHNHHVRRWRWLTTIGDVDDDSDLIPEARPSALARHRNGEPEPAGEPIERSA